MILKPKSHITLFIPVDILAKGVDMCEKLVNESHTKSSLRVDRSVLLLHR